MSTENQYCEFSSLFLSLLSEGRYFLVTKTCTVHRPFEVNKITTHSNTCTQFLLKIISIFRDYNKYVRFSVLAVNIPVWYSETKEVCYICHFRYLLLLFATMFFTISGEVINWDFILFPLSPSTFCSSYLVS